MVVKINNQIIFTYILSSKIIREDSFVNDDKKTKFLLILFLKCQRTDLTCLDNVSNIR